MPPLSLGHRLRVAAVFAVVLAAGGVGLYFGQDISSLFGWPALVSALVVGLLAWLAAPRGQGATKGVALGLALFAWTGGFVGGRYAATASFYEALRFGETVREALETYRNTHGTYPESLEALPLDPLPGERILRENVMQYRRRKDGYEIVLEDFAVRVVATEATPFPE